MQLLHFTLHRKAALVCKAFHFQIPSSLQCNIVYRLAAKFFQKNHFLFFCFIFIFGLFHGQSLLGSVQFLFLLLGCFKHRGPPRASAQAQYS